MNNSIPGLADFILATKGTDKLSVLGNYARQNGDTFSAKLAERLVAADEALNASQREKYETVQNIKAALERHGLEPAAYGI